jgi:hypothetical protein
MGVITILISFLFFATLTYGLYHFAPKQDQMYSLLTKCLALLNSALDNIVLDHVYSSNKGGP